MMWDHGGWDDGDWLAMSLMMVVFWGLLAAACLVGAQFPLRARTTTE